MTFSMPSPVELTQLKIQYQRNVGTPRASNRIELGATAPAPGSTSRASTFLSATTEDYGTGASGRGSETRSAAVFFARPLVGSRWTAGQGPLAQKTPTLLNRVLRGTRAAAPVSWHDEKLREHSAIAAGVDHADSDSSELGTQDDDRHDKSDRRGGWRWHLRDGVDDGRRGSLKYERGTDREDPRCEAVRGRDEARWAPEPSRYDDEREDGSVDGVEAPRRSLTAMLAA